MKREKLAKDGRAKEKKKEQGEKNRRGARAEQRKMFSVISLCCCATWLQKHLIATLRG